MRAIMLYVICTRIVSKASVRSSKAQAQEIVICAGVKTVRPMVFVFAMEPMLHAISQHVQNGRCYRVDVPTRYLITHDRPN